MKKIITTLAGALALCALPAFASDATEGYIAKTRFEGNKLYVGMSETVTGKPACASSKTWDFVVSNPRQREAILRAEQRGMPVLLTGSDACDGAIETLRNARVNTAPF